MPTAKNVRERVITIIDQAVIVALLDPPALTDETKLGDDMGADSLDVVNIEVHLEQEFDIQIPDDVVESWKTIGDVIRTVESLTNG